MGQKRSLTAILRRRANRRQARALARRLFRSHGKAPLEVVSHGDSFSDTQDGHTHDLGDDRYEEFEANIGMIEAEEIWRAENEKKIISLRVAPFSAKGASHLSGRGK